MHWSVVKTALDPVSITSNQIQMRIWAGWTEEEATGAYFLETRKKYHLRIGDRKSKSINEVERIANDFFSAALV
jgi:hypothetical protein